MTSSSSTILVKHLKHQFDWMAGCGRMGGASETHDVVEVTLKRQKDTVEALSQSRSHRDDSVSLASTGGRA